MPVSSVDQHPALIVMDIQTAIAASGELAHPIAEVAGRAGALAAAFRRHGLPVILVNVDGTSTSRTDNGARPLGFTFPPEALEFLPQLDQQPSDLVVTKKRIGAFHGTMLDSLLRERGVTQIFLSGIATTMCVEGTARAGHEHSYNVVVATDACTDRDLQLHEHSVTRILPRVAETATAEEIIAALDAS
ncbi:MAG TPA: isochorismatase family protein [Jatrophihabitans sp.]